MTAPAAAGAARLATRELRLALAMRGGVSLAVWIGGACAELHLLREQNARSDFWRPLLDAAGYGSVRLDVLAGASAGGLNAALLAAALLYGVPFARYRDVWLDVADLRALLRDPAERAPQSVLRGDDYFLAQMEQRLGGLLAERLAAPPPGALPSGGGPVPATPGQPYLDVHLTATLFTARAVPVLEDWAGRYDELTHRAGFRFRHNRFTSDFRHGGAVAEELAGAAAKLALAARATSSFPGAFEPATVRVTRPRHVGARAALTDRDDFFGLFSDASRAEQRVIDGGVLHNIPVGQAIAAIATASAEGPTERWLLYLHPSPDEPPEERAAADTGADTIRTVLASSSARAGAESVLDDLTLLRAHNALVDRYRALRRVLLPGADTGDAARLLEAAAARADDYWLLRAEQRARRIRGLLEDPVAVLGEDPFTSPAERWPLDAGGADWSVAERAVLEAALVAALPRGPEAAPALPAGEEHLALLGPEPVARLAHVCLETVWRLERMGADPATLTDVKQRLYAIADTADLLVHLGDLFWPVYTARRPPDRTALWAWAATAADIGGRFLTDPDANPQHAPDLLEPFAVLRAELRRRSALLPAVATALPDLLWSELVGCCVTLARLDAAAAANPGGRPASDAQMGLPAELLAYVDGPTAGGGRAAGAADDRPAGGVQAADPDARRAGLASDPARERAARALAAVELLAFPLQALAAKPPQPIRFLRVAGTRASPLERHFPGGRLTVTDKLAGNELMNFAAFYKRSWRANDWMWGRLDAAGALVDLVVEPHALQRHFRRGSVTPDAPAAERAAELVALVREQVLRPALAGDPPLDPAERLAWHEHFAALWDEHAGAVAAEAEALFAGVPEARLTATRAVLTARRQWEILAHELPTVLRAVADDGGERAGDGADLRTPAGLRAVLGRYAVGRESFADELGTRRFVALAGDLAVVGWNAVTAGLGRAARPLRPVGWLLRLLRRGSRVAVLAPRWLPLPLRVRRRPER
jgi:patatin-related protein